jgi:hypothetical protein
MSSASRAYWSSSTGDSDSATTDRLALRAVLADQLAACRECVACERAPQCLQKVTCKHALEPMVAIKNSALSRLGRCMLLCGPPRCPTASKLITFDTAADIDASTAVCTDLGRERPSLFLCTSSEGGTTTKSYNERCCCRTAASQSSTSSSSSSSDHNNEKTQALYDLFSTEASRHVCERRLARARPTAIRELCRGLWRGHSAATSRQR